MKRFTLAGLAVVTALLGACTRDNSPTGPLADQSQRPQDQPNNGQPSDAVAAIEVSPAVASANAGSSTQFVATLKNAAGQTLAGRTVVWSTSSSSVVTIDNAGLAVAKAAGTATVTAASEGKTASGSFAVTSAPPPPPPSSSWANEPSGMTTLSNNPFDALNALGWLTNWNTDGNVAPATDPQRANVLRWNFPIGFTGGKGPGMEYLDHTPAKEVYAGFWWKVSNPWQNHEASHVNKIAFWYSATHQPIDIQMYGTPPYRLDVVTQFSAGTFRLAPNLTTSPVTLGVWHKIEMHFKYASSAGGSDGVVEWWMDGVLQGRYTNVITPSDAGFAEYQFSPTWGGLDGVKTENDYYMYDEVHLSRR